jgi:hypothetical protein
MTERNPMTDKLPEFVEQWIAEVTEYRDNGFNRPSMPCIDVDDLRAFLAKFVLCEREPAAWISTLPFGVVGGRWVDADEAIAALIADVRRQKGEE